MSVKKKVLVIDYDQNFINTIKQILPESKFDIAFAADGETAKKILSSQSYDLMITEAMLPRLHGFNLSLEVANQFPDLKIVIVSGVYKGLDYRHQAITQYKANDFFEKPLNVNRFKERVYALLEINPEEIVASEPVTTKIPRFDTAEMKKVNATETEPKVEVLSSEDLFGDIIKNIEKEPELEVNVEQADLAASENVEWPSSAEKKREDADPFKTNVVDASELQKKLVAEKKEEKKVEPVPVAEIADVALKKKEKISKDKYNKIDAEISKKFEETLSGLGLKEKVIVSAGIKKEPTPVERKTELIQTPPPKVEISVESKAVSEIKEEKKEQSVEAKKTLEVEQPKIEEKPQPASQPVAAPQMGFEEKEVGDYIILGMIARGGMAEIYKAKKKGVKGFEKVIAIKKILSGFGDDDKYVEMLVDEAKIAAELSHPNIVQIYDLGKKDNYYFIAMEYVLGKDLREILRRLNEKDRRVPEELSIFIIIKVLEALNYAHQAKDSKGRNLEIVHRDVSPPNIIISYHGDVKLTDFGVSKATIKIHQTISGALKGKLLYMSPEQARGEPNIDKRSDIFSAGVILFELLTGKKLFMDYTEMGVLKKVQNGDVISPREYVKDIDPELERIVMKALARKREDRYQVAAEMISDLEGYLFKKKKYLPGPLNLAHFLVDLFQDEIQREGIKIDLKPIKEVLTEPEPKAEEIKIEVKDEIGSIGSPEVESLLKREELKIPELEEEKAVEIDFKNKKEVKPEVQKRVEPPRRVTPPASPPSKPASFEKKTQEDLIKKYQVKEEKPKSKALLIGMGAAVAAVVVGLMLFSGKKEISSIASTEKEKQVTQEQPVTTTSTEAEIARQKQEELARQQQLEEQRRLQEEQQKLEAQKQQEKLRQAEEIRKKQQLEAEAKKKAEEELRQKQEEEERLRQEEERRKQEEAERIRKEREEKQRQQEEEQRQLEAMKAKEGDVVPLNAVDAQPVGISTPGVLIPDSLQRVLRTDVVMANILINHKGEVETVKLIKKSELDQVNNIIVDTLKNWKYQPAIKDGVKVKVWKSIPISLKPKK